MEEGAGRDRRTSDMIGTGIFISICSAIGALNGILVQPGDWFFAFQTPVLLPPQWVLAIGWLAYFTTIAIVGHNLWLRARSHQRWWSFFGLWCGHLLLVWAARPIFHLMHLPSVATIVIVTAASMLAWIGFRFRRRAPQLSSYILPALLWLLFVAFLDAQITAQQLSILRFG